MHAALGQPGGSCRFCLWRRRTSYPLGSLAIAIVWRPGCVRAGEGRSEPRLVQSEIWPHGHVGSPAVAGLLILTATTRASAVSWALVEAVPRYSFADVQRAFRVNANGLQHVCEGARALGVACITAFAQATSND